LPYVDASGEVTIDGGIGRKIHVISSFQNFLLLYFVTFSDHVFDPRTKNYEVFKTVAQPIVDSSVAGFNGTIFAYGQTSSGKSVVS
jgi:hypothetical protein